MHTIPEEFDLTCIVDESISQLRIDKFQIQIHWEQLSIQGEGQVFLEQEGKRTEIFNGTWKNSCGLEGIINSTVSAWNVRSQNEFSISFESGQILSFHVGEGQYEDFTVNIVGGSFWVM